MQNTTSNRRTWTKPELTVARMSDAQAGANSMLIDASYPATNGTTPHFS